VSATQSSSTTKYSADNDDLYIVNMYLLGAASSYTGSVVCLSVCLCVLVTTSCCCVSATQSSSTTKYSADNDELYIVNMHLLDAAYYYTSSVVCLSVCLSVSVSVCLCVLVTTSCCCVTSTQPHNEVFLRQ